MKLQLNDERVIDVDEEAAFCLTCDRPLCKGSCDEFREFVKELNKSKRKNRIEQKTAHRLEIPKGKIAVNEQKQLNVTLQRYALADI